MDVSKMIAKLNDAEGGMDAGDPLGLRAKLDAALIAIGPITDGPRSHLTHLLHRSIGHGIYLPHLMSMTGFNIDQYLLALSRADEAKAQLTKYAAENRPKVPMVGLVAGDALMPFAAQTEGEADARRQSMQQASGDGAPQMHMIPVEISSTHVDPRVQPMLSEHHIERPPAPKPPQALHSITPEVKATMVALEEAQATMVAVEEAQAVTGGTDNVKK